MDFATFMRACRVGDPSRVQAGLSTVDPKKTDSSGNTPMIAAARQNELEIVRLLVPASDLQQVDNTGHSALRWATYHENIEMVPLLVTGSDLRQTDAVGCTVLMHAAMSNERNSLNY